MQNIQLGDSRVDLARKLTQSTNTNTKGDSAEERSDGGILLTLWSKLEKDYQISIIGNSNPTLSNLLLNLQIQLLETVSNVLRILNCNYITHEDGVPLILQLLPSSSSSLNMPSSETSTGIYWKKLISYLSTIDSKGNRSGTGAGAGFEARNSIAIYPFNEGLVLASLRVIRTMNEYQDFKRCRKLEVGMPWDSKVSLRWEREGELRMLEEMETDRASPYRDSWSMSNQSRLFQVFLFIEREQSSKA